MVILFNEQDLVSFGNYMISAERAEPYLQDELIKGRVDDFLKQVNDFDIQNWLRLSQEKVKAAQQIPSNEVIEDISPLDTLLNESLITE